MQIYSDDWLFLHITIKCFFKFSKEKFCLLSVNIVLNKEKDFFTSTEVMGAYLKQLAMVGDMVSSTVVSPESTFAMSLMHSKSVFAEMTFSHFFLILSPAGPD